MWPEIDPWSVSWHRPLKQSNQWTIEQLMDRWWIIATTKLRQHTATHCNTLTGTHGDTLQHTATHCNTLQHFHLIIEQLIDCCHHPPHVWRNSGPCRSSDRPSVMLQKTAYISSKQCVAVCCSVLQCVAMWCSVLQCVAVCCSGLQCVAVGCSVLQGIAGCCSVLPGNS